MKILVTVSFIIILLPFIILLYCLCANSSRIARILEEEDEIWREDD